MSWLQDLLSQGATPSGGMPLFPGEEEERKAAEQAARMPIRTIRRAPGDMQAQDSVPYMGIGMLNNPIAQPAAPETPPSTNDPLSREPIPYKDGVPLPRARPDNADGPSPMSLAPPNPGETGDILPPNARPATGQIPPNVPPINPSLPGPPASGGGILGKIFNPANAPMLLAMGGGFAGAPSFGTGMRRGFSAAAPQAALLRKEQLTLDNQNATVKALVGKGIPPEIAVAAATNPDLMKQLIPQAFGGKQLKFTTIGEGIGGDKQYGFVDEVGGKIYGLDGKEIGVGGASNAAGGEAMLAKGIKQYDPQLHGEDYFNQFSPEVQSAIKAYIRGDTQPTGNPRLKGFETKVKEWARKYGDDIGVPVSDALFSERRKYRTELGSNQAGTAGGQGKAFVQGIEHADALATQLEKLGNWGGFGIPIIADAANMTREALSTKQAGLAAQARTIGQTLAGEVGKLFSGSAGGGVHERDETRKRFNTVKSGPELAGALEGTLETMEGGLRALEKRRNDVLGPKNDVEFMTPETQAKIARIKDVIGRLRGEPGTPTAATPAPPAASTPMAPGNYIFDPATGKMVKQ